MKQNESRLYLIIILSVLGLLIASSIIDSKFVDGEIIYSATFLIVVLIIFFQLQSSSLISSDVRYYTFASFWEESNRLENLLVELHGVYKNLIKTILLAFASILFLRRALILISSNNYSYKISARLLNSIILRNKHLPLQ